MLQKLLKDPWFLGWSLLTLVAGACAVSNWSPTSSVASKRATPIASASPVTAPPSSSTTVPPPPPPPPPLPSPRPPASPGLLAHLTPHRPGMWIVDTRPGPEIDTTSLSQAVLNAREGDTIWIRPGTYSDNVVVDKSLTLSGTGEKPEDVVIQNDGQNRLTPVTVLEGKVRLKNLRLLQRLAFTGGADETYANALVQRGGKVELDRVSARSRGTAAVLMESGSLSARETSFTGTNGIEVRGGYFSCVKCTAQNNSLTGFAIQGLSSRATAVLENVRVTDNGTAGIFLAERTNVTVRDSDVSSNRVGISTLQDSNLTVERSEVRANHEAGIEVIGGKGSVTASKLRGNGFAGLSVDREGEMLLRDSEVANNDDPGVTVSHKGSLGITGTSLHHNHLSGAMADTDAKLRLVNCKLYANGSAGATGKEGYLYVEGGTVYENTSNGIQVRGGSLEARQVTVRGNKSAGLLADQGAAAKADGVESSGNGAGLVNDRSSFEIRDSTFHHNREAGVVSRGGKLLVESTRFHDEAGYGLMASERATVQVDHCTFERNARGDYGIGHNVQPRGEGNSPPLPPKPRDVAGTPDR